MGQLSAFVPKRCVKQSLLSAEVASTREAAVLFVDVVGFTPLTDRLAKFGTRGTEELSHLLQSFFGKITEAATSRGGDPIAFGGDALTLVFDGPGDPSLMAARDCGRSIQQISRNTVGTPTLGGPIELRVRMGLALGQVTTAVAAAADRFLPINLGSGLDLAVIAAESQVPKGQIVIDKSAIGIAADTESASPKETPAELEVALSEEQLSRFVHPMLRDRLDADLSLLESHRPVTVAFVNFPPVTTGNIHRFVKSAGRFLAIVNDAGGELIQISGGDKGIVALAMFGAPVGHDDDAIRCTGSLLELRRSEPAVRIGIATGPIFATLLGNHHRRFPAQFGRHVNIAARLMQQAEPHQILVDSRTWDATSNYLRQRGDTKSLQVKGVSEQVAAHPLAGWRHRRQRSAPIPLSPFVGRATETTLIEGFLDELEAGQGGSLSIEGSPGIGKTRLTREVADRARTRGIETKIIDVDDFPRYHSRAVWRDLLSFQLGISPSASRSDWTEALGRALPRQAGQLHLLAPLTGVAGQRTAEPPSLRDVDAEIALDMVGRLFTDRRPSSPSLVIVENTHNLDPESETILTQLTRKISKSRSGLLTTQRGSNGQAISYGRAVTLGELSHEESEELSQNVWRLARGGTPPRWLGRYVFSVSGGNPLFVRLATLRLRDVWEAGDPIPKASASDLSIGGLLTERVDSLPALPRAIVNVLAVSVSPCSLSTIRRVVDSGSEKVLQDAVLTLESGRFVRKFLVPPEANYRLAHESLQTVIYSQLSHSRQAKIHRRLAEILIESGSEAREIARHVQRLNDSGLAKKWLPIAATDARSTWNVAESIDLWKAALPWLSGNSRDSAVVELLELLLVGGRTHEALKLLVEDESRQPGQDRQVGTETDIRRHVAYAETALLSGDLSKSISNARVAMDLALGKSDGHYQRASELLINALLEKGDVDEAVRVATLQLEMAEKVPELESLPTAQAALGSALLWDLQPEAAAQQFERAVIGARCTGDVVHEIHATSDLAGCLYELGEFTRCLRLLAEARKLAEDIGYRRHLVLSLTNEGEVRAALGDPYGTACKRLAFHKSMDLGDTSTASHCLQAWMAMDWDLLGNVEGWQRLAKFDTRVGRDSEAAEDAVYLAIAAARTGDVPASAAAVKGALSHPNIRSHGQFRRRVELAQLITGGKLATDAQDGTELLKVAAKLDSLRDATDGNLVEQADISMERWRLLQDDESHQSAGKDLRAAFDVEPSAIVQHWFAELGEDLPTLSEPLPPPVGIGDATATKEDLYAALDQLEAALGIEPRSRD